MFKRPYLHATLAVCAITLSAVPAFAHAHPVTMNPAPDSTRFIYFRDGGSHLQIQTSGLQVEVWKDGTRVQLSPDGARVSPD